MIPEVPENKEEPKVVEEVVTEEMRLERQGHVDRFDKYLHESGLKLSFNIIFTEIIEREIDE